LNDGMEDNGREMPSVCGFYTALVPILLVGMEFLFFCKPRPKLACLSNIIDAQKDNSSKAYFSHLDVIS